MDFFRFRFRCVNAETEINDFDLGKILGGENVVELDIPVDKGLRMKVHHSRSNSFEDGFDSLIIKFLFYSNLVEIFW